MTVDIKKSWFDKQKPENKLKFKRLRKSYSHKMSRLRNIVLDSKLFGINIPDETLREIIRKGIFYKNQDRKLELFLKINESEKYKDVYSHTFENLFLEVDKDKLEKNIDSHVYMFKKYGYVFFY